MPACRNHRQGHCQSRPHRSHRSGDVDGQATPPQEFRKNLLKIRQGGGRNLAALAAPVRTNQGRKSEGLLKREKDHDNAQECNREL